MHPEIPLLEDLLEQIQVARKLFADVREREPEFVELLAAEALVIHMGEIVKRLTKSDPIFYTSEPWSQVAKARDVVAHDYEIADSGKVWSWLRAPISDLEVNVLVRIDSLK